MKDIVYLFKTNARIITCFVASGVIGGVLGATWRGIRGESIVNGALEGFAAGAASACFSRSLMDGSKNPFAMLGSIILGDCFGVAVGSFIPNPSAPFTDDACISLFVAANAGSMYSLFMPSPKKPKNGSGPANTLN